MGTFRSAWRHRAWRRLLVSIAVATTGEFLSTVALVVFLVDRTGSAGWVAASFIARMAAFTLLGPIGGVIADRVDRRRLMVVLNLARAGVMVVAAVLVAADGSPAVVIALAAVVAALTTPYRPAGVAATPVLVPIDDLAAANAAEASVMQLAWFAGPALGAAVVAISGTAAAFAVNAATFALSAALVAGVGAVGGGRRAGTTATLDHGRVLAQLVGGFQALGRLPGLAVMTVFSVGVLLAYGIEQVVHVLVAEDRLGLGANGVGILNACMGAGGMAAIPFSAWLASRREAGSLFASVRRPHGDAAGVAGRRLQPGRRRRADGRRGLREHPLRRPVDHVAAAHLPRGAARSRYSLQDSCGSLAQLAGMVAAPLLVAGLNLEVTLWIGGGSLVALTLVLIPALRAISKRTNAERERLAPLVAELGALGIFAEATIAARERIARTADVRHLPAGTVVFHEGDDPDDLYIVRSGEVAATMADRGEIRRVGAGEWFGEIGLLRGVPRTASIVVVADAELLAISGREFLDAVTGSNRLPEPIAGAIALRLAATHPDLVEQ